MLTISFEKALKDELSKTIKSVFPLVAPEDSKPPYLVYVSSYGEKDQALEGYLKTKEIKCELHIVTGTYAELKSNTNSILDQLTTFQNTTIGDEKLYIYSLSYDKPIEIYEKGTYLYHCFFDITVRL